jgi:DNA-directed RNA polymerase specialized sigma24 family protein
MPIPSDHESQDAAQRASARCSFCLHDPSDTGTLIEGRKRDDFGPAYICSNCVDLCAHILEDRNQKQKLVATEDKVAAHPFDLNWLSQIIEYTLESLTDTERKIVRLRNGLGDGYKHTLEEVGRRLELTSEEVQRFETEAITKLQSRLNRC